MVVLWLTLQVLSCRGCTLISGFAGFFLSVSLTYSAVHVTNIVPILIQLADINCHNLHPAISSLFRHVGTFSRSKQLADGLWSFLVCSVRSKVTLNSFVVTETEQCSIISVVWFLETREVVFVNELVNSTWFGGNTNRCNAVVFCVGTVRKLQESSLVRRCLPHWKVPNWWKPQRNVWILQDAIFDNLCRLLVQICLILVRS